MNPWLGLSLARDRERELRRRVRSTAAIAVDADAARAPCRLPRPPRGRRVGTWVGMVMVRAGERLAGIDAAPVGAPQIQRSM